MNQACIYTVKVDIYMAGVLYDQDLILFCELLQDEINNSNLPYEIVPDLESMTEGSLDCIKEEHLSSFNLAWTAAFTSLHNEDNPCVVLW